MLAAALCVVVVAAAAAWFAGAPGREVASAEASGATPKAAAPEARTSAPALVGDGSAPSERSARAPESPSPAGHDGVVRGIVATPPGVPFPERWTLVVEPARLLHGRDAAVRRTLELDGDQREFELRDLPLAGYAVSAQAPGMNVAPTEVLLVEGSSNVFVRLEMAPAGFVDGALVDEAGNPIEDVQVTLENVESGERLQARTGPDGVYLLAPVRDGYYRISFGDPQAPLIAAEEFAFRAPSLRFPRRALPALRTVRIRVTDELGVPVPDASIQGFGEHGGTIDAVTDPDGEARIRFLKPGPYRVRVHHASGRQGRSSFLLDAGPGEQLVQVVCKP